MKKIHYNKLIRDKIPENITESGGEYETKKLADDEFEKALLDKLIEESEELRAAANRRMVGKEKTRNLIIKELADVIDVLEEIKKLEDISESEIITAQKKAKDKKGGFHGKLYLLWSSDTGYESSKDTPD